MKEIVASVLKKAIGRDVSEFIEVPKEESRGDYAFPCFVLAKELKKNPVEIAKDIVTKVKKSKEIERAESVGPYVNLFLDRKWLSKEILSEVLKKGDSYGKQKLGDNRVMIEFSQANTHKAFHIGHVRGTSLGESLARVMEFCGDKVTRVNYQGDTGMHVAKWIWCYQKYHSKEKLRSDEKWIASIYVDAVKRLAKDERLEGEVKEVNRKLDSRDKGLNDIWKKTRKLSLDALEPVYEQLGTKFDEYFFESEVEEEGRRIAKELVKRKIAKISEGATIIDFKDHGADELGVWVLLRSDDTVLYSAKDIALAERKFGEFKIERSLYVVASEQNLHLRQLFKTLELMGFKQAKRCMHFGYNLVRLPTGKMSSRTGDNVLYSEFREEMLNVTKKEIRDREETEDIDKRAEAIVTSALKYSMLKQDLNKVIVFDKNEAIRFEGDTGPYLLYTYARAQSILGKAKMGKWSVPEVCPEEKNLVSAIGQFPEVVTKAYESLEPNGIAVYCYSLAQRFNEFYHTCKVIGEPQEAFRLALVRGVAQTLENSMKLLGIEVIERM